MNNSAPRPESYLTGKPTFSRLTRRRFVKIFNTDYMTANDPDAPTLNDTQKADLYAELASGAETGGYTGCSYILISALMQI